jgi:hypothetical protein
MGNSIYVSGNKDSDKYILSHIFEEKYSCEMINRETSKCDKYLEFIPTDILNIIKNYIGYCENVECIKMYKSKAKEIICICNDPCEIKYQDKKSMKITSLSDSSIKFEYEFPENSQIKSVKITENILYALININNKSIIYKINLFDKTTKENEILDKTYELLYAYNSTIFFGRIENYALKELKIMRYEETIVVKHTISFNHRHSFCEMNGDDKEIAILEKYSFCGSSCGLRIIDISIPIPKIQQINFKTNIFERHTWMYANNIYITKEEISFFVRYVHYAEMDVDITYNKFCIYNRKTEKMENIELENRFSEHFRTFGPNLVYSCDQTGNVYLIKRIIKTRDIVGFKKKICRKPRNVFQYFI